jgi:type IV pilus assembly protein PilB
VLGFDEKELARFRRFIREPYGMVLVTGPTGSGKTTTLYASLSEIKSEEDKIITIEDPVEYQLRGITQIPVNEKKGLTFARGLRSILRHDPTRSWWGRSATPRRPTSRSRRAHRPPGLHDRAREQRDRRAGPLPEHEDRALQLRVGAQLRAGAAPGAHDLRALQARDAVTEELLRESGMDPRVYKDRPFWEGAGCMECGGTGYKGRMAISELLDLSDNVRELILARRSSAEIKRAARDEGMVFLRESAVNKALAGHTRCRRSTRSRSWR